MQISQLCNTQNRLSSDNNPDISNTELAPASRTWTLGPQPVLRVGLVLPRGKPVRKELLMMTLN